MAECIYCGAVANSKEHWLPRGFGAIRGVEQLQDRLCKECNKTLGDELDNEILHTGPTSVVRSILGIKGRHGTPPNPFYYKVLGEEAATSMVLKCGHAEHNILGDPYTAEDGSAHCRPLRQLVFKKADGQIVPVQFPPAYNAERLAALLKERGVLDAELFEIYLGPDEDMHNPEMRAIITQAYGKFSAMAYGGSGTVERKDVLLQAGISAKYIRGIAKVGFHYFLATSPDFSGAELPFQSIRRFIRHGEGEWKNFVELITPQFVGQIVQGNIPACFSHFFFAGKRADVCSLVQFFVGPDHVTPPSMVRLGITKRDVPDRGHWVAYYGEKVNDYDGEITAMKEKPD